VVVPLLKTTFDLCYDIWQYTVHHPHPIFILDMVFQILSHLARLRYDHVRLTAMKDVGKKSDELISRTGKLFTLLVELLQGGNVAKVSNITMQGRLRILFVTCEQINGILAVFIAAHLDLSWTNWSLANALLQVKLLLQVLSFNWNFIFIIRELVQPMKEKMALMRTASVITVFGGLFVLQRNILLGVIYAGIWHNPTLDKFGTNATLVLVIFFILLSPLSELLYFVSSLVGKVFEDIQQICVFLKGHTSDRLELEQLKRDSDQSRINKKIGFYGLSVVTQGIFLIILNVTNTFDYTEEAYYVRIGVTIYVCLSNVSKLSHLLYSVVFCRCCGWGSRDLLKQANHWHHACCCLWTGGLWFPCWIQATWCRFCCLTPCNCNQNDDH
jgi:hypothetical protein